MSPTLRFSKPILPNNALRERSDSNEGASDDKELIIEDSAQEDSSDIDSSDSEEGSSEDASSEVESSVGDLVEGDGKQS